MAFTNLQRFQRDLNDFAEVQIPREFIRRQVEAVLYLRTRLVHYTKLADATGHAGNNWIVTVDEATPVERGTPLRSWQTEPTNATFQTNEEIRQELTGYKTGYRSRSLSTFYVTNMASRRTRDGGHFYYLQSIIDGNSDKTPNYFHYIALSETRGFIESMGLK